MSDNFRHAQYDEDGVGIDDPQLLRRSNSTETATLQALVSEAGNVTSAALPTLIGATGQTVRLSDGPDKGAILMWSTPAGATAQAWCWWLWPQSAY